MKSPARIRTIHGLLAFQATHRPTEIGLVADGIMYTWKEIHERSLQFAARLQHGGLEKGDRLLIRLPNTIDFVIAYYASLICGAIPVPVFPNAGWERCMKIMHFCKSNHIVVQAQDECKELSGNIRQHIVLDETSATPQPIIVKDDDIALIQYTSGSTGFPKGVMLSHQQLLTNIRQMIAAFRVTREDVFVSWLPVHHDMGLILCMLVPLYTGAKLVLLSQGLRHATQWLEAIALYKGSFTAAPDIAYRLVVKATRDPSLYDLSSLRIALNAAEPIRIDTITAFERHFGLHGVMITGYGLAEASVAVAVHRPGKELVVDKEGHVGSGKALKDVEIRIMSGKKSLPACMVGDIEIKSPACMKGYFGSRKKCFTSDGFLPTGDIGYLDNRGNLFVIGRKKNVIKQGGETFYAEDVEEVVAGINGLRRVAALGLPGRNGSEQLVVVAEYNKATIDHHAGVALVTSIVDRLFTNLGQRPAKVVIVKPRTITVTPTGKTMHSRLKSLYLGEPETFGKQIIYT